MQKIASLLLLVVVVLTSCEGPQGPPGFDGTNGRNGIDGRDGDPGPQGPAGEIATVYEIDQVNFTSDNNFAIGFTFPQPIFDSDVVIAYRLETVFEGKDVWEPMPTSTIFLDDGTDLLYRYNFTFDDIDILLESSNFNVLPAEFTTNQVFRIVVVPGAFGTAKNLEQLSMDSILEKYQVKSVDIRKVSLN